MVTIETQDPENLPTRDQGGKPIIQVSYSELKSWRTCQLQHWLNYRQRQPGGGSPATRLGTKWHKVMEIYYTEMAAGNSRIDALDRVMVEWPLDPNTWASTEDRDHAKTLQWMLDGFLQVDPLADAKILTLEQEVFALLPDVNSAVRFRLKAISDAVVHWKGKLWVVDYKSTSRLQGNESDMQFDDQPGLYLWMLSQLYPDQKIGGGRWLYSVTQDTKKGRELNERFWTVEHSRSAKILEVIAREAAVHAGQAYSMPLEVEPPRSPNPDVCRYMCGFRSECFYARTDARPVFLLPPVKPDQFPEGTGVFG